MANSTEKFKAGIVSAISEYISQALPFTCEDIYAKVKTHAGVFNFKTDEFYSAVKHILGQIYTDVAQTETQQYSVKTVLDANGKPVDFYYDSGPGGVTMEEELSSYSGKTKFAKDANGKPVANPSAPQQPEKPDSGPKMIVPAPEQMAIMKSQKSSAPMKTAAAAPPQAGAASPVSQPSAPMQPKTNPAPVATTPQPNPATAPISPEEAKQAVLSSRTITDTLNKMAEHPHLRQWFNGEKKPIWTNLINSWKAFKAEVLRMQQHPDFPAPNAKPVQTGAKI